MKIYDKPLKDGDINNKVKYFYPNIYDGTKSNHYFITRKIRNKNNSNTDCVKYFLKSYNLQYSIDYEKMAYCLYDYYSDFNRVMNRFLYKNITDSFIIKLNRKQLFLIYQDRLNKMSSLYEEIFLDAFNEYMEKQHHNYDETYGSPYKLFFDHCFSNLIHLHLYRYISRLCIKEDKRYTFENTQKEKIYLNEYLSNEQILEFNLHYEIPEYYQCLKEEFHVQYFSQLQLTRD